MRTLRERFDIETKVRALISDRGLLATHGFASQEALLNEAGVSPGTFRRDLRAGSLSYASLQKILNLIGSPAESISLLGQHEARASQRNLSRISSARLMAIKLDDRAAWFSFVNDICLGHGIDIPSSTRDIIEIVSKLIIPARRRGDFFQAALYSLSFLMWWANTENRKATTEEQSSAITMLLTQYARAAGQAEYYSLHRKAIRISGFLDSLFPKNTALQRIDLDTQAQCISTYSTDRVMLRRASEIHAYEKNIAHTLLLQRHHSFIVDDDFFSCVETYYNAIVINARLYGFKSIVSDLAEYCDVLAQSVEDCANYSWEFTIRDLPDEALVAADLLKARVCADQKKFGPAIDKCRAILLNDKLTFEMKRKASSDLSRYCGMIGRRTP